jgi:hypothetical protein
VGRAKCKFVPFLDIDANGKRGAKEPLVKGVQIILRAGIVILLTQMELPS